MNVSIKENKWLYLSFCIVALLLGAMFSEALLKMSISWESEEYSHGYLIPVISFWFIWTNREAVQKQVGQGSWTGLGIVIFGLLLGMMGEMATLFVITQYAFLMVLYGFSLALLGWRGVSLLWFALAYLFFMIPLPSFLYNNLSSQLQLISSQIGVAVIRLLDISVFLQGNVIDLGNFQLQVVEACSGLRYLFPLTSFGFLCAYFFRAKFWMRALVFLTTLPITVLMNSFRIGIIGILVEYWGIEQAEGFLHDFEGWIIFIGCLGILFAEMWLLARIFMPEKSFSQVFVVDALISDGKTSNTDNLTITKNKTYWGLPGSYIASCAMLLLLLPVSILVGGREDIQLPRERFASFPLQIGEWKGTDVGMGQEYIDTLKFDDYIVANYFEKGRAHPINFYVAYYASQRKGSSAHSPKSCLPGDGWRIGDFTQKQIGNLATSVGEPLRVNRAVISKGESRQLVYYWFQQRGRIITNEYLVKWFLFWDALTQQRTDGALVRLVMSLPKGLDEVEADEQMAVFLGQAFPQLEKFVPGSI